MEFENLVLEKRDGIARLTMNRPEKRNALSPELLRDLTTALDDVEADHDLRVVILTGSGSAFSSGFDLSPGREPPSLPETAYWEATHAAPRTLLRLWYLRQPTIAAVNGAAIAAGNVLALACDIVVASDQAQFAEPEIRHVAHSPALLLPFLTAAKPARWFYYTGDPLDAATAEKLNLVNTVVPHEQLQDTAWRMAERIAQVPPFAAQMMKRSLLGAYDAMGFRDAFEQHLMVRMVEGLTPEVPEREALNEIRKALGLRAFLEARDGPFRQERGPG
ncbi:MAG: enoyl-CoA hydratase/isomerase family protein [Chloroflexi bacterium]|nr:enoyl-CoA hydratase/isomerase family protein [Chloroflexota bacterium]